MSAKPEEKSREIIDQLLAAAGWIIQDLSRANVTAGRGGSPPEPPRREEQKQETTLELAL
jgi:type I site-specific restriction endonuclease